MAKKGWDLTSTHSLEGAAKWIGGNSKAAIVLVIRQQDAAVWTDPVIQPYDAVKMIRDELPRLLQHLINMRAAKTKSRPANPDAEDPA